MVSSNFKETFVRTRKPTVAEIAATPLFSSANPTAIPIAKIRDKLSKIAAPAVDIQGIPLGKEPTQLQISGCPNLRSRAAAGNTAIGVIRDLPNF